MLGVSGPGYQSKIGSVDDKVYETVKREKTEALTKELEVEKEFSPEESRLVAEAIAEETIPKPKEVINAERVRENQTSDGAKRVEANTVKTEKTGWNFRNDFLFLSQIVVIMLISVD